MPRDEVVAFLERYARSFAAPVREGVTVRSLVRSGDDFILDTSDGQLVAETVVVTTGSYQRPYRPAAAASFPARLQTMEMARLPAARGARTGCCPHRRRRPVGVPDCRGAARDRTRCLPVGRPRAVGASAHRWARHRALARGHRVLRPAPRATRVARGPRRRQPTGRGRRKRPRPELQSAARARPDARRSPHRRERDCVNFASDLAASVAYGDARYNELRARIREHCARIGAAAPEMPDPEPFDPAAPDSLPIDALGAVIFACGFRLD